MKDYQQAFNYRLLALTLCGMMVGGCAQESNDEPEQVKNHAQPMITERLAEQKSTSKGQSRRAVSDNQLSPQTAEIAAIPVNRTVKQYQNPSQAKLMQSAMAYAQVSADVNSAQVNQDKFATVAQNGNMVAAETPVSTFSIDVDTGSYSTTRRLINQGQLPAKNSVRVEELINYFSYDYPAPSDVDVPFNVTTELAPSPYNQDTQLLRIGIKGFDIAKDQLGASNLVLLLDVSGSMSSNDKLPLLKQALLMLSQQLSAQDKVSIVVYAGASGVVLDGVAGNDFAAISHALEQLNAQGGTNGSQGIQLAYQIAQKHFIEHGINRVILATDGDFNLGMTDHQQLVDYVATHSQKGIGLSTLGFGLGNYNDHLLEQLSNKANGQYAYIDTLNEARKVLVDQLSATLLTIAHDVKVQIEFNPAVVSEYRLIGYENRMLNRSDFNNDAVDAGEIGAGHNVTALYELRYNDSQNKLIEPLRYHASTTPQDDKARSISDEVAFLKLRYKAIGGQASQLLTYPITKQQQLSHLHQASDDFRFAAAVAGFGQLLNHNHYVHDTDYAKLITLAESAMGQDRFGYRHEFVQLLKTAKVLSMQPMQARPSSQIAQQVNPH